LKAYLAQSKNAKPKCVIVDVDETVLDNSPFQAYELQQGKDFDLKDWQEWTAKAAADTVPGAPSFLKFAAQNKVETFYVTNRGESEREATLKNLKKWNFPYADNAHLLLKSNASSDKEPRRVFIGQKYDIVLLCGDNLNDFSSMFFTKDETARNSKTESAKAQFGRRFIVLPNPMYGDWMDALYDGKKGLTEQEKADVRMKKLKGY
ncbi:MAG: 5'-nucleotidase, lipoprotein e(P4) family, partial [Mucilaginibacter polytrichastri]|nr:5'-nucleotidase, lipoprotein e(P4) family [Mucilaginibacter polytrichastri]